MGVDTRDNFEDEEGSVAMELADFSPAAFLAPSSVTMSPVIFWGEDDILLGLEAGPP